MLKFLLGIVVALIFVAALGVWVSLPGGQGDGTVGSAATATTEKPAGGGLLLPKKDGQAATRGIKLSPKDTISKATDAAATAAMRRVDLQGLGLAVDVPENWLNLDANGMRRYFSEFQGMSDPAEVNQLVSTIILATIRDWPDTGSGGGAVANVVMNHRLATKNDVIQILNTVLDQKRAALDNLDGKIARYMGKDSDFGIALDSLVDVCSFGMAPALMIYHSHLQSGWGLGLAFCFLLCGALRLARFNAISLQEVYHQT